MIEQIRAKCPIIHQKVCNGEAYHCITTCVYQTFRKLYHSKICRFREKRKFIELIKEFLFTNRPAALSDKKIAFLFRFHGYSHEMADRLQTYFMILCVDIEFDKACKRFFDLVGRGTLP